MKNKLSKKNYTLVPCQSVTVDEEGNITFSPTSEADMDFLA